MSSQPSPDSERRFVPLSIGDAELELSELELATVQPLLEAAGIDVIVQGATPLPNLPYELLVPEEQLEQARQVLREAMQAGPEGAAEAESETEGQAS
jgi:hypothetical protein